MEKHSLQIDLIVVEDRQRIDLGDIDELASSIQQHGLIQPIVVTLETFRLVAGGRRLAAVTKLGWKEVPVVYKEKLTPSELFVLELEENIRRKSMTWQEHCLTIAKIHRLKFSLNAQEGVNWTQQATAELLGIPGTREINQSLRLARLLENELDENKTLKPDARFWKCETVSEAHRLIFRDEEAEALSVLASKHKALATPSEVFEEEKTLLAEFEAVESSPDAFAEERARYYSNPHNPPDSFDDYWKEKQEWAQQARQTIYLSTRLIHGDSIKYMRENPSRFDHVITDIPYGIDMAMLNQQNPHGTMRDIDTVEELHDVNYNKQLIADFFPAAFTTIKDKGFCITWCDQMLWQFMYDCATKAGFAVQRWPITWVKTQAMNQCVAYNTTKDTEIAIVCRKPGTTLSKQPQTSVVHSGKDGICQSIDHPFAKPFDVWRFVVELASVEGESILEPFAGRGSGVISMLKMNRNVIGVELDDNHYNALLENVKQLFYLPLNPNYIFR